MKIGILTSTKNEEQNDAISKWKKIKKNLLTETN